MVTKYTGYRASDGTEFSSEIEAYKQEVRILINKRGITNAAIVNDFITLLCDPKIVDLANTIRAGFNQPVRAERASPVPR